MGLKFRIFTKAENNSMSSPAAALRRALAAHSAAHPAAPSAAPSAPPSAAPKVASSAASSAANQCFEFRETNVPCSRNNCRDSDCRTAKAKLHTASPKRSAPAKSAGVGGGISAQLTAMETNLMDHIDSRINAAQVVMTSGFSKQEQTMLGLHQAVAQSQLATQQSIQALANAMATAISGGQRQLPPPERRQIGNGAQEIAEPQQRQISNRQTAGFDPNAERSGMSATSSSQFVIHKEARTEFHGSSGGSTLVAARQLGVGHHLPYFEANFSKMKPNDFNNFVGAAIRKFVESFPQEQQDEMACVLLGMVNGKKYSAHNSIIINSNESIFRRFLGELAKKFPTNAVKTTNKRGQEMSFPFSALSTDPSAMCTLIRVLRGDE